LKVLKAPYHAALLLGRKSAAGVTPASHFVATEVLLSALLAGTLLAAALLAAALLAAALFFTLAAFTLLFFAILLLSALLAWGVGFAGFVWILLCVHVTFLLLLN
jgi:hypothetical protein